MLTAKDISSRLAQQAERVCRELLPAGRAKSGEWTTGDVTGGEGKSCKVRLTGEKAGVWCDFATGESGDLIDLWATVRGIPLSEAFSQAKAYLGIAEPAFHAIPRKQFAKPKRPACAVPKAGESLVLDYLSEDRGIDQATVARYRVAERERWMVLPFLRNGALVNVKQFNIDELRTGKKQPKFEKGAELCLWGWQAIPGDARKVVITEGEIDAMTMAMMGYPALSVPNGCAGMTWVENDFETLARFDEIIIAMDSDDAGLKGAADLIERLGRHRCRWLRWPDGIKDANEALAAGWGQTEFAKAVHGAQSLDPDELKNAASYTEAVIEEFYPSSDRALGLLPPWNATCKDKLAFRPGELTIWTGYNGCGKSSVLSHLMVQGIAEDLRVCIASMEIKPARLLKWMVKQTTGMDRPSPDYIRESSHWLGGGLWLFDVTGTAKTERLLEVFDYARRRYGVNHFVVDSLMKCGIGEDDYTSQKLFVERLIDFSHDTDTHVHLVAHARKGPNEEQPPGKMDVKGTGAITDLADNVITVWRNKAKEGELEECEKTQSEIPESTKERPDASVVVSKQRFSGWEGKVWLWFDRYSLQFHARPAFRARSYIDYSAMDASEAI